MSITPKENVSAEKELEIICERLRSASTILLCSHMRPDGDCLGSKLALSEILASLDKRVILFNQTPIPVQYNFLPDIDKITQSFPGKNEYDLVVCVDCGSFERVGAAYQPEVDVINIDHHASNTVFGTLNYIDPTAIAVGEQIKNISDYFDVKLTKNIAQNLMLSIISDTGSFRYAKATTENMLLLSELAGAGADTVEIAQHIFHSKPRGMIQITGEVLDSLHFEFEGKFCWAEITQEMFDRNGGPENEPEGLSAILRGIMGVEVSCLMHETAVGFARASLRSKGNVDVSKITEKLGGGGHHNAAGASIEEPYVSSRENILQTIRESLAGI